LKVIFASRGWDDYLWFYRQDVKLFARLNDLIEQCRRHPFTGTGKPEPLRENWVGFWSRRLDKEHRLIYRVIGKGDEQRLEVAQCRYHY
jgi:toxin YoeB